MIEIFKEDSPFIQEDNRRFRPIMPATAEALNFKHDHLFPKQVVEGHTVLDIGSCTGSTGYWCNQLGASRYVGVEHQEGYISLARRLNEGINGVEFVQSTAEDYFKQDSSKFDVVCLMGVAHGVYDALSMIKECASRASKYVCFDDQGWFSEMPLIQAKPIARMVLADQNASSIGFGWMFSTGAIDQIMAFLGFKPDMQHVFPTNYRWFCRYVRFEEESLPASFSREVETWETLQKYMEERPLVLPTDPPTR